METPGALREKRSDKQSEKRSAGPHAAIPRVSLPPSEARRPGNRTHGAGAEVSGGGAGGCKRRRQAKKKLRPVKATEQAEETAEETDGEDAPQEIATTSAAAARGAQQQETPASGRDAGESRRSDHEEGREIDENAAEEGEEDGDGGADAKAADPYLLAEAAYLRKETRWVNRQRVLVLGSRGMTHLQRHLMEDFKRLLPHHKAEAKWERKQTMRDIGELAQLRSCNNVLYFESRKRDLLLHVAKIPLGPTMIFRVLNIHTLAEMKMTGNCLLHSRPLLLFSPEFGSEGAPAAAHLALLRDLFVQVFGTPRNHPKAKPFFDHAFGFYKFDGNRVWFRHYQIAPLVGGEGGDADKPDRQTFVEIGPRCVLEMVKVLEGAFSGQTLWSNPNFVCSRDLMALQRAARSQMYAQRVAAKEKRSKRLEEMELEEDPLAFEHVFGDFVKEGKTASQPKKRRV